MCSRFLITKTNRFTCGTVRALFQRFVLGIDFAKYLSLSKNVKYVLSVFCEMAINRKRREH